ADRLMTLTSGEAPAVLMRTSGTTAQPKLVGLTHANVLAATDTMRVAFELTESDVCIMPMPLHHVHGLIAAALSALSAGSSIHCCETFSPRSFDQALRDYAPTWLTAAPALHIAMNDYYAGQNSTPIIRTLRCFRSSSAPLPPASIARLEELYAAPLLETYGLTETASTLCSNRLPPGKRKPGSVGQAISADQISRQSGKAIYSQCVVRADPMASTAAAAAPIRADARQAHNQKVAGRSPA